MATTTLTNAPGLNSTGEVIQRNTQTHREGILLEGTWDERLAVITNGEFDPSVNELTSAGSFTNYSFTSGDKIWLMLPTGDIVLPTIASKIDDNTIELADTIYQNLVTGIISIPPGQAVPRHVEVRVVDDPHGAEVVGWTRLTDVAFDTPGTWRGILAAQVPVGGWYNWEWRIVGNDGTVFVTDNTSTGRWAVGAVFALMGQSNMTYLYYDQDNVESTTETPLNPVGFFGPVDKWYRLSDVPNEAFTLGDGAAWTASSKTLTKTGAFSGYTWTSGDKVLVYKSGVFSYLAEIASKVSNDAITLVETVYATDLTGVLNQQLPRGLTALANQIRTGFTNIPLGFIGASVPGSAIRADADYLSPPAGHWLGSGVTLLSAAQDTWIETATRDTDLLEAVLWLQGEAEATASIATNLVANNWKLNESYYTGALNDLEREVQTRFKSWRDVPLVISTIGRYAGVELDQVTGLNVGVRAKYPTVIADQIEWSKQRGHGVCQLLGEPIQADYIHFTPASRSVWGKRFGQVVQASIGDNAAGSTIGPEIVDAVFGDEVTAALVPRAPTDAELRSRQYITLRVKHDQGTTLVLGTHSHVCFTVADQHGPLYVSAVTLGPAVSAGGTQLVRLTVERNTAATTGKDRPFYAPTVLDGASAIVRYLYQSTIPHSAAPLNRLIYDNATVPMPLLMPRSYGYDNSRPRDFPGIAGGQVIRGYPKHAPQAVSAAITALNLGSNQLTIEAPTSWDYYGAPTTSQLKPGDWFIISLPFTGLNGIYQAEGTIRRVVTYTNESTAVVLELSHDFTGQVPTTSHKLDIVLNPQSESGVLALARSALSFGG